MEDLISIVDRSKLDYTRVEHGQMARKVTLLIRIEDTGERDGQIEAMRRSQRSRQERGIGRGRPEQRAWPGASSKGRTMIPNWSRFLKIVVWVVVGPLILGSALHPQSAPRDNIAPQPPSGSRASGQKLYNSYCASCHGRDGRGSGPVASVLRTAPTDLTALANTHGGSFPESQVRMAAKGESPIAAHGSVDMPVWGPIFLAGSGATSSETEQHVNDLVKYIESLQSNLEAAKPVAPLSTSGH